MEYHKEIKMIEIMKAHSKKKRYRVIKPKINACKYGMLFIKSTHLFGWVATGPP
jgi:hypothetical protein